MAVFKSETSNTLLSGTSGNDTIKGSGGYLTLDGGKGNDSITNSSENVLFKYSSGDGNDIINGFNATSTLSISGSSYSTTKNGDNLIVTVGDGEITLVGAASLSKVNIKGTKVASKLITLTEGNDTYSNTVEGATIDALGGDDSIQNGVFYLDNVWYYYGCSNVIINGGNGNDYIDNENSDNVSINGGAGNDYILTQGSLYNTTQGGIGNDSIRHNSNASVVDGGDGSDYIANSGWNVTINGGIGNDSIINSNANVSINAGSGDDKIINSNGSVWNVTINGGKGNDTIILNSDAKYAVINYNKSNGNDKIYGFDDDDTLSISGSSYSTTKSGDNIIVTVGTGKITLVGAASLGSSLNIAGTKKVTTPATLLTVKDSTKSPVTVGSAVKVINASSRTKAVKITGNKLANSIVGGSGNDTLNGGKGNDTLTGGKGKDIFVYSGGNDVITDYTAEDKISITSGTTAKVSTSGNNVIFTVGSNKITVKGGKDKTITYSDAGGKNKKYKYEEPSADDEIVILPKTYSKENYTMGNDVFTLDASAVRLDLNIVGNKFANSIIGSDQNDTLAGGKANDTLTGKGGTDVFVYKNGDGNDLITDYTEEDIIHIASGTISTVKTVGKDVIFTIGNGKISLKGAADKIVSYIDAGGEHTYGDTISAVEVKGKTVTISENYTANSFDLTGYAKTMKTINATAVTRDLTITANDNANSILGGAGNDTLIGGKGNDTLNGKGGADIFLWNSGDGNDLILNYAEEDKIKITSGTVKTSTSGKNVILSVGSNKITVKGAADKIVTYINKNGTEIGYLNTVAVKGKVATLSDKYSRSTFVAGDYSSAIRTINASKVSKKLSITGSAFADSIAGGAGNDTLIGGHGNDTLKGGNGSDIFVYSEGDGNDTITDYSPGDKIKIASGTVADKVEVSGKDVVFTVNNSGTITVKNGKGKKITVIDKNGNESGKIYNSSKLWFTADDTNFDNFDNQLDSIIKSSPAYSFNTSTDLPRLTPKNNFITYADKK